MVRLGRSPASVLLLSFLQPFEPRHHFLSIGYRFFVLVFAFVNVSTVSPLSSHYFTTGFLQSSVLWIYGFPPWILGPSLSSPSPLFVMLLDFIFPGATWFSLGITVYS